jgi:hypothetical protein
MAGEQRKSFTKGHLRSSAKNPYQDPTYLTFTLMFDPISPLFNKEIAVKTLRDLYQDETRANKLKEFIKVIKLINTEMPWYFKSITGVDRALDIDMTNPYWGGDDAVLEIDCNESINLAITGLMDLYRDSVYDLDAWTGVLPENYRKFNLHVTVSEVRTIASSKSNRSGMEVEINNDIIADNKPQFMFIFGNCEFVPSSGKETFETLNSESPEMPNPKIRIKYEQVTKVSATYLNGISDTLIDDNPGIGYEERPRTFAERASQALNDAASTVMNDIKSFNPASEITRPNNVYGSVFDQAFENALNQLDNAANIPGNFLSNQTANIKGNVIRGGNKLGNVIKENIYGLKPGFTFGQALSLGAVNSILPEINSNIDTNLGNVFE